MFYIFIYFIILYYILICIWIYFIILYLYIYHICIYYIIIILNYRCSPESYPTQSKALEKLAEERRKLLAPALAIQNKSVTFYRRAERGSASPIGGVACLTPGGPMRGLSSGLWWPTSVSFCSSLYLLFFSLPSGASRSAKRYDPKRKLRHCLHI